MIGDAPRTPAADASEDEALLGPTLRAAVLRDLSPSRAQRDRVRSRLLASLAMAPASSLVVQQADAEMAARAVQLKAGVSLAGTSLATKLVVSSLVIASAAAVTTTAVRHHAASRPSQQQTMTAHRTPDAQALKQRPAASDPAPPTSAPQPDLEPSGLSQPTVPEPSVPEPENAAATSTTSPVNAKRLRRMPQPSASLAPRGVQLSAADAVADTAAAPALPSEIAASDVNPRAADPGSDPGRDTLEAGSAMAPSPTASVAGPSLRLGDELALVRAASDALTRRDPSGALDILSRYAAGHPDGALRVEAQALRVIALCDAKRAGALEARDAFLRAHARSNLARRVRSACTW